MVTENERFAGFANEEYRLTQDSILYKGDCGVWTDDFMLAAEGQESKCLGDVVAKYPKGTIIRVAKIIDEFGGSSGRCWRIQVQFKGRRDLALIDIPACHLWHPKSCVTSSSPFAPVILDFKPEFAVKNDT